MNIRRAAILLLSTSAFAGLYVPTQALLVNQAKALDVDLKSNGLLAHVCDSSFNVGVKIDLKRISDEEKFRMVLDPRLSAPLRPGQPPRLPTNVVLQQIPPGKYVATKITLGDKDPVPFKSDTLVVQAGHILSLGRIRIEPKLDFMGFLLRIEISTQPDSIQAKIKAIHSYGIDTLPIQTKSVKWTIEKDAQSEPAPSDTSKKDTTKKSQGMKFIFGD
jgi:hypothetical protein